MGSTKQDGMFKYRRRHRLHPAIIASLLLLGAIRIDDRTVALCGEQRFQSHPNTDGE